MPKPPLIRDTVRRELAIALLAGFFLITGLLLAWLVTQAPPF